MLEKFLSRNPSPCTPVIQLCYYRRSVILSFDCIKKYGFNSALQIVPSQECVLLSVGNELNNLEVLERCVIELALYSAYYLGDEKLVNRSAALCALQFNRDFYPRCRPKQ